MAHPYTDPEDPFYWKNILTLPQPFRQRGKEGPTEEELKMYPEIDISDLGLEAPPQPPAQAPTAPMTAGKALRVGKKWNMVGILFNIREQIKLYHWQTTSYSQHKTTDDLVKSLDTNIDAFVEAYMGTYGRPVIEKTLPVKNLTSQDMKAYLRETRDFLVKILPSKIHSDDADLLAIRDTILGDVDKAMFLFTLA
jgi:hypothetical protein